MVSAQQVQQGQPPQEGQPSCLQETIQPMGEGPRRQVFRVIVQGCPRYNQKGPIQKEGCPCKGTCPQGDLGPPYSYPSEQQGQEVAQTKEDQQRDAPRKSQRQGCVDCLRIVSHSLLSFSNQKNGNRAGL